FLSHSVINTIHLVGFHAIADNINKITCLALLLESNDPDPMIVTAIDYVNSKK
ncbi:9016_t:CDS:1, partial [Gigaspora margarita]